MVNIHYLPDGHVPLALTIGAGQPGLKTLRLREIRNAAIRAGFHFPDHLSLTPRFFERFLWDCNVREAKNPYDAVQRIMDGHFADDEIDAICRGLRSFRPMLINHMLVRSDEWAGGLGFSHTGPAILPMTMEAVLGGDVNPLIAHITGHIKRILAADYNKEMVLFRQRKGITENSGVILMPLYGEALTGLVAPILSVNAQGVVGRNVNISVGAGFGGANNKHACSEIVPVYEIDHFVSNSLRKIGHKKWDAVSLRGSQVVEDSWEPGMDSVLRFYPGERSAGKSIETMLRQLLLPCPAYVEFVRTDWVHPHYVLVQYAPFREAYSQAPRVEENSIVLKSKTTIGTKSAVGDTIHYLETAGGTEAHDHYLYNKRNSGYVAVVNARAAALFGENFSPSDFSNSLGIVIIVNEINGPLVSHIGGGWRDLGIPVIAVECMNAARELLDSLRANPTQARKCTLFADEFHSTGFLAVEPEK